MDKTRPCIDTSGNYHVETDIFDVHDYEQNVEKFKADYDKLFTENVLTDRHGSRQKWAGEPVFMSEYGGIKVDLSKGDDNGDRTKSWGYGNSARSLEEFYERYEGLTAALLDNPKMLGFCYTQLTDIEQEQNGISSMTERKNSMQTDFIKSTPRLRQSKNNDDKTGLSHLDAESVFFAPTAYEDTPSGRKRLEKHIKSQFYKI